MTVATLGLAVDSRPVAAATAELNRLATAAAPAEAAVNRFAKAGQGATSTLAVMDRALKQAVGDINVHQVAMNNMGKSAKNSAGSLANLSYQVNDIASGLVMGQSPFMIMAQQGGQVFQVWQQNNNVFREAGRLFLSFLTPLRLLAIGAAAAAVAGVALYSSWKSFALGLDDVAKSANTTSSAMAQLQAAASFKGIDRENFTKGIDGFAQQIYQARNNMGGLIEVLRANGLPAVGNFTTMFGRAADLIKNASGDTQKQFSILRQMGLPATMEWVRFLSQGADGIKRATEQAAAFGGAANDKMTAAARRFDEAWNRSWTNFVLRARNGVVETIEWLDRMDKRANAALMKVGVNVGANLLKAGQGTPLGNDFNDFYDTTGADRGNRTRITVNKPGDTIDPAAAARNLSLESQRIGILGQLASVTQQVRAAELQVLQARAAGVSISEAELAAIKERTREQALGLTQIKSATDAQKIELETIGMSTGQMAAYTAAQNALNDAKRNGRVLTAEQVSEIQREANVLGEAAQRADNLRFGYETFSGAMRDLNQQIRQNGLSWQTLGNVAQNVLGKLSDKLADIASQSFWQALGLGGGGGGGGGGIMSLLGLGGGGFGLSPGDAGFIGPVQFAHSGYGPGDKRKTVLDDLSAYNSAPRFHSGIGPGERRAVIRDDESVLTPGQMKAMGEGGGGKGVTINNSYSFVGIESSMEARLRQYIDDGDRRSTEQALTLTSQTAGNVPGYRKNFR